MALPYSITGKITGSLSSGSFLSEQDNTLFMVSQSRDVWFGFSSNDVIEFGVYDPSDNSLVEWETLYQQKTYTTSSLSYLDALNVPRVYDYKELNKTFVLYKNTEILANPVSDLNSVGITEGSYKVSYVFSRDMAGNPTSPLSIKEISPSRTEIKLIPQGRADVQYSAFCYKKFPVRDVAPVLLEVTKGCPYDQVYSIVSRLTEYQNGINYLKFAFFLVDDGSVLTFLKNLYEDLITYTVLSADQIAAGSEPTRISRTQGIRSYFSNYLITSYENITDFDEIENKFGGFINIRLDQKFGQLGNNQDQNYKDARKFCYDFFFKFFYEAAIHPLQFNHQEKYFSSFKNVLNFGENRYFSIVNTDYLDERIESGDPLTLVIKLSSAIPNDIAPKDTCWVSNFAMTPCILTVNLLNPVKYKTIRISPANFGAGTQFITKENVNKLYSAEDLAYDTPVEDDITVQKNIATLNTDYSSLENFVVFSSADTRLTLFENKIKSWYEYSSSLDALNQRYLASLSSSAVYAYYTSEKTTIEKEMSDIINSFDGYESYLFNGGKYAYSISLGSFISSSYIVSQHETAQNYDKSNTDCLLANTPEYILNDSNNEDYLTFLDMMGHHFDNIYTYIAALPIQRQIQNEISSSIPTNTLKQMLSSFGWSVDDIISSLNIDEVYLNSLSGVTYNTLSADQRLQIIWNRILVNLPGIYKAKGTEECVRFLLSCYGLPSSLITIREYGGTDYSEEPEPTYQLDEKSFMTCFSGVSDYIEGPIPQSVQTVEFKFSVEQEETYTDREYHSLFTVIPYPYDNPSYTAWSIGISKLPGKYSGQIEFRMESGSTGTKITSSALPLFNGEIFSVMLKQNEIYYQFEDTILTSNVPHKYELYVQQNEGGRKVFYSTSSAILLAQDNAVFSQYGRFRFGNGVSGEFIGTLDKLAIWDIPLDASDFDEHVDDINSYGFSGSTAYTNLWVKLGVDYPLNLYCVPSGALSSSVWVDNQSVYYAIPNYYSGDLSSSLDPTEYTGSLAIIAERWQTFYPTGSVEIIARNFPLVVNPNYTSSYNTTTCRWDSGSAYPYHFREIIYQQNINASKFGPNKFKNKKIRKVDYQIEARLDSDDKSTNMVNSTITGESNQIGFFIDPQDSKNKDIIRYLGREGIMALIADPADIYAGRYSSLVNKNYEYVTHGNKRTYFNELLTVYKFYFDKSIFEAIKNVLPARANIFTGVVIEPTILERPKYRNREISSSVVVTYDDPIVYTPIKSFTAEGLWLNFNDNFSGMTSASQETINATLPPNYYEQVDLSYVSDPTRGYPCNLSAISVKDLPDTIQNRLYADFENSPRRWELTGAPANWPIDAIKGSLTREYSDDLFVVGPDQNSVVQTSDPISAGYNQGSHSIVYYMLKMWKKHEYFTKTGEYFHTNVPGENTYSSNSVYLYNYVVVTEPFMRRYLYWYDLMDVASPPNYDASFYYFAPSYLHRSSTFKNTPDQLVSNISAVTESVGHTITQLLFRPDSVYFEIAKGYPVNHYTHKMTQFSKVKYGKYTGNTTRAIYVKGSNNIDTTVNMEGINDGTFPVQSFNTSNVNVVNASNVIQSGAGDTNVGSVIPSATGATGTTGTTSGGTDASNATDQTKTGIVPVSAYATNIFGLSGRYRFYVLDSRGRRTGKTAVMTKSQYNKLRISGSVTIGNITYKYVRRGLLFGGMWRY